MLETDAEYWLRHLKDFKKFEFEERMLRQKYEQLLLAITELHDLDTTKYIKTIVRDVLGEVTPERRKEIQSYDCHEEED